MGRVITQEKLMAMADARLRDPEALGPVLGEFIVNGNIPVGLVAKVLNVSEPTVYRWMFSQAAPRDKDKIAKVQRLLTILRKAKRVRDLPLVGNPKACAIAFATLLETHKPLRRSE